MHRSNQKGHKMISRECNNGFSYIKTTQNKNISLLKLLKNIDNPSVLYSAILKIIEDFHH